MKLKISLLVLCALMLNIENIFAYDSDIIHRKINETVVTQSMVLKQILDSINYDSGANSVVKGKKVFEWFRDGGEMEDKAPRWVNHFHDPTKDWSVSGLYEKNPVNPIGWFNASSLSWAQDDANEWSWFAARRYFYQGLIASDFSTREENFSKLFRALGQVMHLVSDAGVPAHVRNDGHPFSKTYETWCAKELKNSDLGTESVSNSITTRSRVEGLAPITNFWDTQPTAGSNPTPEGLAEYTNQNFLSEDTIFFKGYDYPQNAGVLYPEEVLTEDGKTDTRLYFSRTTTDNKPINHLASTGYFAHELMEVAPDNVDDSRFNLDDLCYKDYAAILVPKAVGYSSGLLDYFFRGQMQALGEEVKDPAGDVTEVRIQVKNTTAGETMSEGEFVLSYRYKPAGASEYIYSVSTPVRLDPPLYPFECGQSYSFLLLQNIPADATEKMYTLAFKGILGHEAGAVVAKTVEIGSVGFSEEWSTGLQGQNFWLTTDREIIGLNADNGSVVNQVLNGRLIKENIRNAGTTKGHINQTYIGDGYHLSADKFCIDEWGGYCVPYDFGTAFPLPITPCTQIRIKIDEMSMTAGTTDPACSQPASYQGIILKFDNGINLAFTVPGQVPWVSNCYINIQPGYEISFNIHDAFAAVGFDFGETTNLLSVDIVQKMSTLCEPAPTEQRQRMVVDYIRLEN